MLDDPISHISRNECKWRIYAPDSIRRIILFEMEFFLGVKWRCVQVAGDQLSLPVVSNKRQNRQ